MGQTYDSGSFEKIMDQGLALADWNGYAARREASKKRGKLRGRGIATFLEWTSGMAFEEKVSIDVTPDGFIEIYSATQQMGQGIQTSYAQLAVDVFGVPIEKVRIVQGDTDRGNGFGSAGSRSLFTGGSAVKVGAERTVEHAKDLAAEALEAAAADIEYRGRPFLGGRHRPRHRPVRAGRQAGRGAHPRRCNGHGGRPRLAERLPCLRGRDRSRQRRGAGRLLRFGQRHRPGGEPGHRRAARSTAARSRASARRSASRSSTTKAAASS
jgi:carbon-monoxide dehydrogenase large subunit